MEPRSVEALCCSFCLRGRRAGTGSSREQWTLTPSFLPDLRLSDVFQAAHRPASELLLPPWEILAVQPRGFKLLSARREGWEPPLFSTAVLIPALSTEPDF